MKKRQKKHLFARTCRVLGRFLLVIGAVLCLSSVVIACAPLLFPTGTTYDPNSTKISLSDPTPEPADVAVADAAPATNSSVYILPSVIVVTIIIIALALSFRHYNRSIRNLIAFIAKKAKLSIHITELILSTIIWSIAIIVIIFNAPVFSALAFTAMVFNNLLFIFAWTSYGCPAYSI